MKRRDFIKQGMTSVASLGVPAFTQGAGQGTYTEVQKLTLGNKYLDWDLVMTGGTVKSTGVRNKLSGQYYKLSDSKELLLTFSRAKARVEIPWWDYELGRDNDTTLPDQERGYLQGYHREDFGKRSWGNTQNLLLRDGVSFGGSPIFNGYAWFRQWFELPTVAEGEQIVFCLGGYNQEDWNEYWVYVNGHLFGHWTGSGRWRTPKNLTIQPGSPEYPAMRFGTGHKNLLAVRTYRYDKRFEGVSDEIAERYIFDGRLVDQFISVGQPYLHVSDFNLKTWRQESVGEQPHYIFELSNPDEQLQLSLHYKLDEFMRRKWFEVKNLGKHERLLLDVDVDDFSMGVQVSQGDYGQPIVIGEEMFCALEHPAGLNQGMGERVRLRHFPGTKLAAGASVNSRVSVLGVGPQGKGRQQFLDYIQARSPRRGLLSVYDPLGINGFPDEPNWTLCDREMLGTLDLLEKWQKQGVKFDYYVPDVGWQDWAGDLTRFWPNGFPDGPGKVIQRVNELGMKWGLWFAGTWADWSCGLNPRVIPSRTVPAGGTWPENRYRDGFDVGWDGLSTRRRLCLASEPYFSILRDALLYHIRHDNLRFYKIDESTCYCNSTEHPHLPGKYSTEANFDALIEIARVTRQASPDLYIMWYWGLHSPFFLLYGDSIFDKQLKMEACNTGDHPTLFFRDGVTLVLDQGAQSAKFVPPTCMDSLGVFITDTWLANSMRKERWRENAIMDLGRGNLLFPQIWGDLYSFSDDDVAFLARIQRLAKQNETLFFKQKRILGDPWKNEVYGYAYFEDAHGLIFMNNANFQARPICLKLGETLGLKAPAGRKLRLLAHFPGQEELRRNGQDLFMSGDTIETWLRPFEVAMWEVLPEGGQSTREGYRQRELPVEKPDVESHRLSLETEAVQPWMEIHFGEPNALFRSPVDRPTLEGFAQMGYEKRVFARKAALPVLEQGPHVLAILLRFHKDGKPWRYTQPADLAQMRATIGDQLLIRFETVPSFRATHNMWSPWLVFRTRMSPTWSSKTVVAALNAYLPPEVQCQLEAWVIPQWWG
jgi:hypothetical protein